MSVFRKIRDLLFHKRSNTAYNACSFELDDDFDSFDDSEAGEFSRFVDFKRDENSNSKPREFSRFVDFKRDEDSNSKPREFSRFVDLKRDDDSKPHAICKIV